MDESIEIPENIKKNEDFCLQEYFIIIITLSSKTKEA